MASTRHAHLLIVGGGPAGYTAAIYAARANLHPVLIQGLQPGGQLMITTEVENYPGFAEAVMGPWLMDQFNKQAEHCGAELVADIVTEVDLSLRPFRLTCDSGDVFFFRGRPVAVVGGGNTAVEEALYLSKIASKVTLIHRRDQLRAEKILQDRLFRTPNIEVLWNHVVEEVLGTEEPKGVTGLRLRGVRSGEVKELPVDGLFVAIGHDPSTKLFAGQLEMDAEGYIVTAPDSTRTSRPGVFAAGDVQDRVFRQAVTAAGTGCMAALEAEKFLAEQA